MLIYKRFLLLLVVLLVLGLLTACDAATTATPNSASSSGTTTSAPTTTANSIADSTSVSTSNTTSNVTTVTTSSAATTSNVTTVANSPILPNTTATPAATNTPRPVATTTQVVATTTVAFKTTTVAVSKPPTNTQAYKWVIEKDGNIMLIKSPHDAMQPIVIAQGSTPIFSPDGKRVAFIGPPTGDSSGYITTVNLNGDDKQTYCNIHDVHPLLVSWLPDNYAIMYGVRGTETNSSYQCRLQDNIIFPPPVVFGNHPQSDTVGALYDWNAIYKGVVAQHVQYGQGQVSDVFYINGSSSVNVTNGANAADRNYPSHSYDSAAFSPDDKTIAITGRGIYFVSVPGQTSPWNKRVIHPELTTGRVVWSADGEKVSVIVSGDMGFRLDTYDVASGRLTSSLPDVTFVDRAKI